MGKALAVTLACSFCGQPRTKGVTLAELDGRLHCRACLGDVSARRPVGSTAARRSLAVTAIECPHCGATKGTLCRGPGIVRFIHARRRDAAAELQRKALEDGSYGN